MLENFTYQNPVKIIFGEGTIASLAEEIPADANVMVTYGGGSIKKNGVYDQVKKALAKHRWCEFGGIEPNPRYETLMKAVKLARTKKITFLLAVGGGSVIDGTKFIAAAIDFKGDAWDILAKWAPLTKAVPLGSILTLPATGSEMNTGSVISREETNEKLFFQNPLVFPRFSILDPTTTYSLPERQVANGVVDTFVHTTEQYLTKPAGAYLQDRQAEALLNTLVDIAPVLMDDPADYDTRAALMWTSTNALNGLIGCGVPQDWVTHMIGHELTALHGLDHAQTLAIVLPQVLRHNFASKKEKLAQMYARVWQGRKVDGDKCPACRSQEEAARQCILCIEAFFHSLGVKTQLSDYGIRQGGAKEVERRFAARGVRFGENGDIGPKEAAAIVRLAK